MESELTKVTLVIPSYNESQRLPLYLTSIAERLSGSPAGISLCVVVVDDGSRQAEYDAIRRQAEALQFPLPHELRFERFEVNRGKGAVLRDGFRKYRASSEYVCFSDADGATPFSEMFRLMAYGVEHPQYDVLIGSRWKALGYKVERTIKRHISGRVFATILSNLFNIPVYDSQCGAKVFRSALLTDDILDLCDNDRWLFDTQLLLTFFRAGASILEVPVNWADIPGSKVSLFRDSWRMFLGLYDFKKRLAAQGR